MTPQKRVNAINCAAVAADLDGQGWAVLPGLIDAQEGSRVVGLYDGGEGFRSHVVMARHCFGGGEYRYFAYPLPDLVQELRTALYPRLMPIANTWQERMGNATRFPADHAVIRACCHAAGQTRPTVLLLQYGAGDYNCLHQDLYGEHVFPLQGTALLSQPSDDFEGGEFVSKRHLIGTLHARPGIGDSGGYGRHFGYRRSNRAVERRSFDCSYGRD